MNTTDQSVAQLDSVQPKGRWRWSQRRSVMVLGGLTVLVFIGLVAALVVPTSTPVSSDNTDEVAIDQPESNRRTSSIGSGHDDDGATAAPAGQATPKGKGGSSGGQSSGGGSSPTTPAGPVLVVESEIFAEQGANGALFLITNAGGAPLSWSVPQEDGVALVDPEFGTVAPGAAQVVSFELPHPLSGDFVYPITIESDGGTAEVNVHLDAFDPVFEIVDGTWNIRNGNTFLVSYTDMDVGLTLKNIGNAPLHVEPQDVDGLAVIGGPWDLAPGAEVHLHLVLCNAMFSGGVPDFHDRDFHIHTDSWMGTLDFMVRFTLAPGQVAAAC